MILKYCCWFIKPLVLGAKKYFLSTAVFWRALGSSAGSLLLGPQSPAWIRRCTVHFICSTKSHTKVTHSCRCALTLPSRKEKKRKKAQLTWLYLKKTHFVTIIITKVSLYNQVLSKQQHSVGGGWTWHYDNNGTLAAVAQFHKLQENMRLLDFKTTKHKT